MLLFIHAVKKKEKRKKKKKKRENAWKQNAAADVNDLIVFDSFSTQSIPTLIPFQALSRLSNYILIQN